VSFVSFVLDRHNDAATRYWKRLSNGVGEGALGDASRSAFERRASEAYAAGRRFAPMRSSAQFVRGLSFRLRGRPEGAHVRFAEAAKLAALQGASAWEAEAHAERGRALLECGESGRVEARAALEQACALFQACHAGPREQRTLATLTRLGGNGPRQSHAMDGRAARSAKQSAAKVDPVRKDSSQVAASEREPRDALEAVSLRQTKRSEV
jgi:hypothetical protein